MSFFSSDFSNSEKSASVYEKFKKQGFNSDLPLTNTNLNYVLGRAFYDLLNDLKESYSSSFDTLTKVINQNLNLSSEKASSALTNKLLEIDSIIAKKLKVIKDSTDAYIKKHDLATNPEVRQIAKDLESKIFTTFKEQVILAVADMTKKLNNESNDLRKEITKIESKIDSFKDQYRLIKDSLSNVVIDFVSLKKDLSESIKSLHSDIDAAYIKLSDHDSSLGDLRTRSLRPVVPFITNNFDDKRYFELKNDIEKLKLSLAFISQAFLLTSQDTAMAIFLLRSVLMPVGQFTIGPGVNTINVNNIVDIESKNFIGYHTIEYHLIDESIASSVINLSNIFSENGTKIVFCLDYLPKDTYNDASFHKPSLFYVNSKVVQVFVKRISFINSGGKWVLEYPSMVIYKGFFSYKDSKNNNYTFQVTKDIDGNAVLKSSNIKIANFFDIAKNSYIISFPIAFNGDYNMLPELQAMSNTSSQFYNNTPLLINKFSDYIEFTLTIVPNDTYIFDIECHGFVSDNFMPNYIPILSSQVIVVENPEAKNILNLNADIQNMSSLFATIQNDISHMRNKFSDYDDKMNDLKVLIDTNIDNIKDDLKLFSDREKLIRTIISEINSRSNALDVDIYFDALRKSDPSLAQEQAIIKAKDNRIRDLGLINYLNVMQECNTIKELDDLLTTVPLSVKSEDTFIIIENKIRDRLVLSDLQKEILDAISKLDSMTNLGDLNTLFLGFDQKLLQNPSVNDRYNVIRNIFINRDVESIDANVNGLEDRNTFDADVAAILAKFDPFYASNADVVKIIETRRRDLDDIDYYNRLRDAVDTLYIQKTEADLDNFELTVADDIKTNSDFINTKTLMISIIRNAEIQKAKDIIQSYGLSDLINFDAALDQLGYIKTDPSYQDLYTRTLAKLYLENAIHLIENVGNLAELLDFEKNLKLPIISNNQALLVPNSVLNHPQYIATRARRYAYLSNAFNTTPDAVVEVITAIMGLIPLTTIAAITSYETTLTDAVKQDISYINARDKKLIPLYITEFASLDTIAKLDDYLANSVVASAQNDATLLAEFNKFKGIIIANINDAITNINLKNTVADLDSFFNAIAANIKSDASVISAYNDRKTLIESIPAIKTILDTKTNDADLDTYFNSLTTEQKAFNPLNTYYLARKTLIAKVPSTIATIDTKDTINDLDTYFNSLEPELRQVSIVKDAYDNRKTFLSAVINAINTIKTKTSQADLDSFNNALQANIKQFPAVVAEYNAQTSIMGILTNLKSKTTVGDLNTYYNSLATNIKSNSVVASIYNSHKTFLNTITTTISVINAKTTSIDLTAYVNTLSNAVKIFQSVSDAIDAKFIVLYEAEFMYQMGEFVNKLFPLMYNCIIRANNLPNIAGNIKQAFDFIIAGEFNNLDPINQVYRKLKPMNSVFQMAIAADDYDSRFRIINGTYEKLRNLNVPEFQTIATNLAVNTNPSPQYIVGLYFKRTNNFPNPEAFFQTAFRNYRLVISSTSPSSYIPSIYWMYCILTLS